MTICIDTNVVLGKFTAGHAHSPLLDGWLNGRISWAVSTEILLEYDEIMVRHASPSKADHLRRIMELGSSRPQSLLLITPTYRFRLITADPDDDKFADCAIAVDADYIITAMLISMRCAVPATSRSRSRRRNSSRGT
jgi:predicted nucleic acid-binding protein